MPKNLDDYVAEARETIVEVTPSQVRDLLGSEYVILDVREPDEFAEGHLPGAKNISRGFLEVKADANHHKRDEAMQDRNQKIICYCGGGYRSLMAAKTLLEMGFVEVKSMSGGFHAWEEEGLPVEG